MRPPADCTRPPVRPTRTRRGCGNEPPTTRRICARGAPVLGLQLLPQHHVGASRSRASVQFRQGHQPMRSAVERRAVRAFRRSSGSGTRPRRRVVSTTDRHRPRCGCPMPGDDSAAYDPFSPGRGRGGGADPWGVTHLRRGRVPRAPRGPRRVDVGLAPPEVCRARRRGGPGRQRAAGPQHVGAARRRRGGRDVGARRRHSARRARPGGARAALHAPRTGACSS